MSAVEVGQVRKGQLGVYWGVVKAHPRRKGFWICASHEFPYALITAGRRELEELPISTLYSDPHPGIDYWEQFQTMIASER